MNLVEKLDHVLAACDPEQAFLVLADEQLTYGSLREHVAKLGGVFEKMRLQSGDRVLILSTDEATVTSIFAASLRMGLTAIVGDAEAPANEVLELAAVGDPAAIFADRQLLSGIREPLPVPASRVVCIGREAGDGSIPSGATHCYSTLLRTVDAVSKFPDVQDDTLGLIVFTSGSTSKPKGVCLSHSNLYAQLEIFGQAYGFDTQSKILNILPMHHVDGLIRGPLAALFFGAQIHRPLKFSLQNLKNLLDAVPTRRVTHFISVPAMLNLINRLIDPTLRPFQGPSFRFIICSADILEAKLWKEFEDRFGVKIVNAYGLSEVVCDALFSGPHIETRSIGTIGVPLGCNARVVDESGNQSGPEEVGELALKGPTVMQGYFRQPDETNRVLQDGWFNTGDLVRRGRDGYYRLEGRKKTVVISAGVTIHPESITSVILEMPGIAEAVSFGVGDDVWGQRLVTCVTVDPEISADKQDVFAHCRENLSPEKIPSEIHFVQHLPRGPSGNVILASVQKQLSNTAPDCHPAATVFEVAAECFNLPVDMLTLVSSPYNTEGWDSPAHLSFIMRLEEVFQVRLSAEDIIQLGTLADAEEIIERLNLSEINV